MYAYTLSLLGDRQQAQDVMQETNLILWEKSDQFRPGSNFAAWMLKIAYFQVMTHRRRRRKLEQFVFDDNLLENLAAESSAATDWQERQQAALQACLEKLPERQREIVHRRYSEGYSIRKLAGQLGAAAPAIKQTLFRARSNLIKCVQFRLQEGIS